MPAGFLWTNLVNFFCLACLSSALLLTGYCEAEGLNRWQIGLLGAAFSFAGLATRVQLGAVIGRIGLSPLIRVGSLVAAMCVLCYANFKPEFYLFLLLRSIEGVAMASYFTALWTRVVETSPSNQLSKYTGLFGISGLIAGAGGPFVLEQIQNNWGTVGALRVAALLGFTGACLSWGLPNIQSGSPKPQEKNRNLLGLLSHRPVQPALWAGFTFGLGIGCLNTFISPFLQASHIGTLGSFFVVYTVSSIGWRLVAGRLSDGHRPAYVMAPALLLYGSGLTILSLLAYMTLHWQPASHPNNWHLLVGFFLGSGHGLFYPALSTMTVRRTREFASPGSATAGFTACIDLGILTGSAFLGYLAHHFGYGPGFLALGALMILATLLFYQRAMATEM